MSVTAPSLLLVFGMPRSGTTWLGKIFDSHPDTAYLHEPDSREPLRGVPLVLAAGDAPTYEEPLRSFVERLPVNRSVRVRGKLPLFDKTDRGVLAERLYRVNVLAAKALARVAGDAPVMVPGSSATNVWKSIESPGRLPALLRLYPKARAVYILRHPCGYVASVLRGERDARFGSATSAADDRGVYEQLLRSPVAKELGVTLDHIMGLTVEERLAWRWVLYNEHVLREAQNGSQAYFLKYEDLCAAPRESAQSLFVYAGLSWQAATERFLEQSTARSDETYYGVHRDPMRAANRWQQELDECVQRRVERVAAGTRAGRLYQLLAEGAA